MILFEKLTDSTILPEFFGNVNKIYSSKYLLINPLQRAELNLLFSFCHQKYNFFNPSQYFFDFELNLELTSKKGLLLLGHNFNWYQRKKENQWNEEFKLLLYNSNWPEAKTGFTGIFGDRNKIEIKAGDLLGFLRISNFEEKYKNEEIGGGKRRK